MAARSKGRRAVEPLGEAGGGPPERDSEQADGTVVPFGGPSASEWPALAPGLFDWGSQNYDDWIEAFLPCGRCKLGHEPCFACGAPVAVVMGLSWEPHSLTVHDCIGEPWRDE